MKRCKACGSEFRKGTIAFLLTAEGLKGSRVCQKCAQNGVLLVSVKLPPISDATKANRVALKEQLKPFVKNLVSQIEALKRIEMPEEQEEDLQTVSYIEGKIEALENCVHLLKKAQD